MHEGLGLSLLLRLPDAGPSAVQFSGAGTEPGVLGLEGESVDGLSGGSLRPGSRSLCVLSGCVPLIMRNPPRSARLIGSTDLSPFRVLEPRGWNLIGFPAYSSAAAWP